MKPGNHERGWNDPPQFIYESSALTTALNQSNLAPKKYHLNKRLTYPIVDSKPMTIGSPLPFNKPAPLTLPPMVMNRQNQHIESLLASLNTVQLLPPTPSMENSQFCCPVIVPSMPSSISPDCKPSYLNNRPSMDFDNALAKDPMSHIPVPAILDPSDLQMPSFNDDEQLYHYVITRLYRAINDCKQVTHPKILEEIEKKLTILSEMWKNNKISYNVKYNLAKLATAIHRRNLVAANEIHLVLTIDYISEVSRWLVGIKKLVQEIEKVRFQPLSPSAICVPEIGMISFTNNFNNCNGNIKSDLLNVDSENSNLCNNSDLKTILQNDKINDTINVETENISIQDNKKNDCEISNLAFNAVKIIEKDNSSSIDINEIRNTSEITNNYLAFKDIDNNNNNNLKSVINFSVNKNNFNIDTVPIFNTEDKIDHDKSVVDSISLSTEQNSDEYMTIDEENNLLIKSNVESFRPNSLTINNVLKSISADDLSLLDNKNIKEMPLDIQDQINFKIENNIISNNNSHKSNPIIINNENLFSELKKANYSDRIKEKSNIDSLNESKEIISSDMNDIEILTNSKEIISSDINDIDNFINYKETIGSDKKDIDSFINYKKTIGSDTKDVDSFINYKETIGSDTKDVDSFTNYKETIGSDTKDIDSFTNYKEKIGSDTKDIDSFTNYKETIDSDTKDIDSFTNYIETIGSDTKDIDSFINYKETVGSFDHDTISEVLNSYEIINEVDLDPS